MTTPVIVHRINTIMSYSMRMIRRSPGNSAETEWVLLVHTEHQQCAANAVVINNHEGNSPAGTPAAAGRQNYDSASRGSPATVEAVGLDFAMPWNSQAATPCSARQ